MKYKHTLLFLLLTCVPLGGLLMSQVTVSGTVTDSGGDPLIGANVVIAGTTTGTATDVDGQYTITVDSPTDTLAFSYTGFIMQRVPIQNRSVLDVVLLVESRILDEIVVVGYGVQRKSDLTGSISSVKGDEVQRIPSGNVEQALQGKVAGVLVTPSSGEPGAGAIVRIRGTGTLNDASPLYVVDNMLLNDISFLNPNDIASIEVLKDASATAIYGSRGANGVIIITTKRGSNQEKATISVDVYYGSESVINQIDLVSASEYALLTNELAMNTGGTPPFTDPSMFGTGTDWQDVIFRNAPIASFNISASGGSEKAQYSVSANYFKQEGVIRGSDFDRVSLRVNNTYKLNPAIDIGHNLAFVYRDRMIGPGVVGTALRTSPITSPFDTSGNFSDASVYSSTANAEASIFYNNNNSQGQRGVGNVFADVHFLKNFTFRTNFGLDIEFVQGKNFNPVFDVSSIQVNEVNDLSVFQNRQRSWLWENTVTYIKEWDKHRVNVLGGITSQEFFFEGLNGRAENLIGDAEEFHFLDAGTEQTGGDALNNNGSTWAMVSYLGRVNYTFLDKYLFTASIRADGSSKFGEANRYGYFPSFAVGWNLTSESFMQNQNILDRLKFRASWGQIGNEKINSEAAIAVVDPNLNSAVFGPNEQSYPAATPISLANPELRWEETTQTNIGIEFGVLNNRLTAEIDYYRRVTNDILTSVPIPNYVGSQADPVVNAAEVLNRGFDLTAGWQETRGKFSYNVNFVGSTVYNEVLGLGEGKEEIFAGGLGFGGILGTRTVVGLPIGSFYGYVVDGVFQNTEELNTLPKRGGEVVGDLRFRDLDGDGVITDEGDRTFIGNPIPEFIYGFSAGAEYAGFDFNIEFNGQSGNDLINAKKMARFGNYNYEVSYLDRWNGEGTSNTEPRVTNSGHNYEFSTRFVEDGSYMRLRNVQLGYTLPQRVAQRVRLNTLRVYVSGTNLVTWTDFTGYTPEISSENVLGVGIDGGSYPIAKTIVAGINISF